MWDSYKAFLLRGNLLELAVAFVLGVAFSTVVTAFTDGIVMALIGALFGEPNFDQVVIPVGEGQVLIGTFLTAVLDFLIVATALFFVVQGVDRLRKADEEAAEEEPAADPEDVVLLREIRDLLSDRQQS